LPTGGASGDITGVSVAGAGGTSSVIAAAGMAGVAGQSHVPCSGGCTAPLPVCDAVADVCVACTRDAECAAPTPACTSTNTCVQCTSGAFCSGATPVCRLETNTCVECIASSDCVATPDKPVCDASSNSCVGCVSSADCASKSTTPFCHPLTRSCTACIDSAQCNSVYASRCEPTTSTCVPCTVDGDCSQVTGKSACNAGTCVKCTTTNESACVREGYEYSCNPKTNECTGTKRNSVALCGVCVADSECTTSAGISVARCVPMVFGADHVPRGSYCLEAESSGCGRPFGNTTVMTITAISASGAPVDRYCGINQELVTCEAIRDMQDSGDSIRCTNSVSLEPNDSLCGCVRDTDKGTCTTRGQGGLCRPIGGVNRCTIQCGEGSECPTSRSCTSIDSPRYCG
jgi:hypothetical protein